ncbi:MAG: hypothetical protein U0R76_10905 [Candidatus Nanopelagicales bacterium]
MSDLDLDAIEREPWIGSGDVPALVAALREARDEVERLRTVVPASVLDGLDTDDRTGSVSWRLIRERDDWRRRYEALRDGVTGLCAEAELRYGGTVVAGDLRAIVARVDES